MGFQTKATAIKSTAIGDNTQARGEASTAMGFQTDASGNYSTAMGYKTHAIGNHSTAMGKYNTINANNIFSVGVGSSDSDRKDAFSIDFSGNLTIGSGNSQLVLTKEKLEKLKNLLN